MQKPNAIMTLSLNFLLHLLEFISHSCLGLSLSPSPLDPSLPFLIILKYYLKLYNVIY